MRTKDNTVRSHHDDVDRWAKAHFGIGSRAVDVAPMPGNSGLSFGFRVMDDDDRQLDAVVMRLAPPGVPRSGNTDVLHQVSLLQALERAQVPVAPVIWSSDDALWFGTDALAQRLLPARPLHMLEAEGSVEIPAEGPEPMLRAATAALAQVHRVDWKSELPDWSAPAGTAAEVDKWWPLLAKAATESDQEAAGRLREMLHASAPSSPAIGLIHGDYQTNNVLYSAQGDLVAIVDWEIAGIGAQGLDVGWLAMMTDPDPWGPEHRARLRFSARPADIHRWYAEAAGQEIESFDWFRALAEYRFAAIVAYNLRLHRTGRRPDAIYETLESSIRSLIDHATTLLAKH